MTEGAGDPRIATLDVLRGVAVMGILTMNIVAFAMPEAAYANPRAYGGDTGADLVVYLINFVLFDTKMRGLFSLLFGASALLVMERAEARRANPDAAHYARMAWLLVFGLLHLYLLWWGDILHHYALVGLVLPLFRHWRPRLLILIGVALAAAQLMLLAVVPVDIAQLDLRLASARPASATAIERRAEYEANFGTPASSEIAKDLAAYRGSYADTVRFRANMHATTPTLLLTFVGMETLSYMLIGMALLKTGMLRGNWPAARYRRWALIGLGIGIPSYSALGYYLVAAKFSAFAVALAVATLSLPLRLPMILGWASAVILFAGSRHWLVGRIAAAGRMAFTNYVMTSIVCTLFFYGYGLGFYGQLSRAQLYAPVIIIWALILAWSAPWLERHRYGPLEWLWRSAARARWQRWRR
ncbi:MAG: DUF418 domain-containing protein [Sphingomonas sp.]